MALDATRNAVYDRALAQHVTPDSAVLDLGAGVGIFGMLALKYGARHVYCVEPQDIGAIATEIAAANGWTERLTVLQGRIEDITLPEKVDIIVSAMTGNLLFNEDLLPTVFHARDTHLRSGGVLIPSAAAIDAVPVSAPKVLGRHLNSWTADHLGVDMSAGRRYAANVIVFRDQKLRDARALGDTRELFAIDLGSATYEKLDVSAELGVIAAGSCDGIAAWLRMKLGDEWLSTGPFDPQVHWAAACVPVDPPVDVQAGDSVDFRLIRPPHGDWVWRARFGDQVRQGSTMFARPQSRVTGHGEQAKPVATERAHAVAAAIAAMDGTVSVDVIAAEIAEEFPSLFPTRKQATGFVRRVARTHGRESGSAMGE